MQKLWNCQKSYFCLCVLIILTQCHWRVQIFGQLTDLTVQPIPILPGCNWRGKGSWGLEEEAMQKSLWKARAALCLLSTHRIVEALAGKLQALILWGIPYHQREGKGFWWGHFEPFTLSHRSMPEWLMYSCHREHQKHIPLWLTWSTTYKQVTRPVTDMEWITDSK